MGPNNSSVKGLTDIGHGDAQLLFLNLNNCRDALVNKSKQCLLYSSIEEKNINAHESLVYLRNRKLRTPKRSKFHPRKYS